MAELMKVTVASMLKGIDRYNPENLNTLQKYVEIQAIENAYDLEANLAVLKLYQFNPNKYKVNVAQMILLKALTNLPHTDFVLCKCLIEQQNLDSSDIAHIVYLHNLLETCDFTKFWEELQTSEELEVIRPTVNRITGFDDSIRKFICHVVNITYQIIEKDTLKKFLGDISEHQLDMWISRYDWREVGPNLIFVSNQEENIKTKNINEKIEFDSVAAIMSLTR